MLRKNIPLLFCLLLLLIVIGNRPIQAADSPLHTIFGEVSLSNPDVQSVMQDITSDYANSHDRPPIVLVHGWQGANIGLSCERRDLNYVDGNWDQVDEEFERLGFHVEMARLYSGGAFTASDPSDPDWGCTPIAEENAPYVIEAIDDALAATGQSKVILVGHSMGGLVSRAYIESNLYRGDVVALYTLGTPHIGVPVDLIYGIVDWLVPDPLLTLEDYCNAQHVVCQFSDYEPSNPPDENGVTRVGIESFNNDHNERADGVYYHLLGGDIGFDDRSILCDPLYLLIPGANDCIVPRPSATGISSADGSHPPLSGTIDRMDVYAAHIELFTDDPNLGFCGYHHNFHNKDWYCSNISAYLVEKLASSSMTDCLAPSIDGRYGSHTCGSITQAVQPVTQTSTAVKSPRFAGQVMVNSSASHTVEIEAGLALFTVYVDANAVSVHLVAPDGSVLNAESEGVHFKSAETALGYTIPNAMAGEWQIVITGKTTTNYRGHVIYDTSANAVEQFMGASASVQREREAVALDPTVPEIDDSVHTCVADNTGPYQPSDTINLDCTLTVSDEDEHTEWIDLYFVDAPDGWNITGQNAAPADAGGWGRTTTTSACTGLAYWGIDDPFLAPLADECDLSLSNLPTSGSHNGPWMAFEGGDVQWGPESFETAVPPSGWQMIQTENPDGDSSGWQRSSSQAYTGGFSAFHNDDSTCSWPWCLGDFESWLIMPNHFVRTGEQIVWWQRLQGSHSGFDGSYDFWISLGSSNPNDGDYVEIFDLDEQTGAWTGWSYDLTEYTAQNIHIAFRYYADDDHELYLDNVYIRNEHIATASYEFDTSFTVSNDPAYLCPGSEYVGVTSATGDSQSSLVGVAMGDLVDFSVNSATTGIEQACPLPAVTLDVTVSTTGSCPGTATVNVFENDQEVTYCYQLTNNSADVTVVDHDLVNSLVPDLNQTVTLAPLQTTTLMQTVTLAGTANNCYDNDVTWTATTATGLGQPQGNGANVPFSNTTYNAIDMGSATVCVDSVPTAVGLNSAETQNSSLVILILLITLLSLFTTAKARKR